jgi:hypothetical protein
MQPYRRTFCNCPWLVLIDKCTKIHTQILIFIITHTRIGKRTLVHLNSSMHLIAFDATKIRRIEQA